jgi:hypothetical protein
MRWNGSTENEREGNQEQGIYYRPYLTDKGVIVIVCMQDFDEIDYHHSNYVTDEKFYTEPDAQNWCHEHYEQCRDFAKRMKIFSFD